MTAILADRSSYAAGAGNYTIDGHRVKQVAIQESKRTARKGQTYYIYVCNGMVLYNMNPNMPYWSTFGTTITHRGKKYDAADVFEGRAYNEETKEFLELNNYRIVIS